MVIGRDRGGDVGSGVGEGLTAAACGEGEVMGEVVCSRHQECQFACEAVRVGMRVRDEDEAGDW